jgi:hypothetical protein
VLIASPARLEALTGAQRGWLQEAAEDAADRSAALSDTEAQAIEAACAAGARFVRASDADVAALDQLFAPVYADLERDQETKTFITQIRALKQTTAAERDAAIPAGCTGTATDTGAGGAATPADDPLAGEWHQTFTCQDALAAVQRGVESGVLEASEFECDAPGDQLRIARFDDGRLFLLDPPAQEVGLVADYRLVDDDGFTLSDGGENIPGSYRFEYRIEGDRLIVDVLEQDPFFVAAWEAAPFVRVE